MQPIPIPENITQVTKDLAKKVFTMLCLNVDKNDNNSNNGEQGNKDNKNKDELDSLLIDKVNAVLKPVKMIAYDLKQDNINFIKIFCIFN